MKKIKYILLLFWVLFTFNNCSEDIKGTEELNYAGFEGTSASVVVNQNSSSDLSIKIYSTRKTGSARTFNLAVVTDKTSADVAAYDVPSSVTIPANSNVGEFTVTVSDENLDPGGNTVVLRLESNNKLYTGDNITINVQLYCPLNISDFLGEYMISEAGYGEYPTTITKDPDVENRIWVTNFWDWTNDLVYLDFNPDNGKVSAPSQVVTMGDGNDYTITGNGTYNACAGTFHMEYGGDVEGTVHDFYRAE